eukprot:1472049-Amphidinium_carterae.1
MFSDIDVPLTVPPGGPSSGADDIPSLTVPEDIPSLTVPGVPMRASPKKRQRRFIMEPGTASPSGKSARPCKVTPVPMADVARPPPLRRCCMKRPPPPAYTQCDILEEVTRANVRKKSNHPHRLLEDMVKALAMDKLREHPTIPPSANIDDVDAGGAWPGSFCAFKDCKWTCFKVDDEALDDHLRKDHYADLEPITHELPVPDKDDVMS